MILTLTPNPSNDRTVRLGGVLERGAVLRAADASSQAAGKGVNISRAAVAAGLPTVAVVPAATSDPYVVELVAAGVDCHPVSDGDATTGPAIRVNLTLTEPDGTTTKVNSPGSPATPALLAAVEDAVARDAGAARWVVLAGSLPPGTPAGWYADLVTRLRAAAGHALVAVDTSEAPLAALVDALPGAAPDLMKPNGEELASFTGGDPDALESDPVAAAAAAATLVDAGVGTVLATLGAHGAVLVTTVDGAVRAWHATPPPTTVVSTVGAGDSSLFGYLLGEVRDLDQPHRLALAVAYGSAAAGLPGTTIPHPEQVRPELVTVRPLAITRGG